MIIPNLVLIHSISPLILNQILILDIIIPTEQSESIEKLLHFAYWW